MFQVVFLPQCAHKFPLNFALCQIHFFQGTLLHVQCDDDIHIKMLYIANISYKHIYNYNIFLLLLYKT